MEDLYSKGKKTFPHLYITFLNKIMMRNKNKYYSLLKY